MVLMQVFFAVVGANGSFGNVLSTTPSIFAFASVQIAVHLLLTLAAGRLLGLDRKLLLTRRDSRARVRGRLQLAPAMGPLPSRGSGLPGLVASRRDLPQRRRADGQARPSGSGTGDAATASCERARARDGFWAPSASVRDSRLPLLADLEIFSLCMRA